MGMAASQVRLLALTSRLHDVEFEAQSIQSQKIALATQKDALYQDYCNALDATKIQVAYMNDDGSFTNYVDASFATMCSYVGSDMRSSQYSLIDSKTNKVIVDEETYNCYQNYNNDKYSFAWAMLGFPDSAFTWNYTDPGSRPGAEVSWDNNSSDDNRENIMTPVEEEFFNRVAKNDTNNTKTKDAYTAWEEALASGTKEEQREAFYNFRDTLYENYAEQIYSYMAFSKNDKYDDDLTDEEIADAIITARDYDPNFPEDGFDQDEFNFYVRLFENIQEHNGCTTIDPVYESGEEGETWLNNMVNAGLVLIEVYNKNEWTETSISTSSTGNFLRETQDETDLKKAEAEYEHELDKINDKDTDFDNQLNKLETERSAITQEIESINTVIDDNIERTFGIFS